MGPGRSFVKCMDAVDLWIAAPKNPKSPRPRHALAVQARKPSVLVWGSAAQPGRAGPGRPGEEWALYTACIGFEFALHTPVYMRCAPAATPHPSQATPAGPHALVAQTPRFAAKAPHATQAVKPARVASGERLHGVGLAILHRLPASVALQS